MGESHQSSPLDQLGVFTYQSLTLMCILIICSVALNRFQSNRRYWLVCKIVHSPIVEFGLCGWKPKILTARPTGTVHSSILNYDALLGRLFSYLAFDFQLIKGLAGLQNFSQSGNRTRDLRVKSANPNSMYRLTLLLSKTFHSPGVEPGTCGWKPPILTARPTGSVQVSIPNSDQLVGRLFCCIESISR